MASYQSSFDPPPRPENGSRAMKLGTYTHVSASRTGPSQGRLIHREVDIAHISGQVDKRPGVTNSSSRQTGLPKPSAQSQVSTPDSAVRSRSTSKFGFGRRAASPPNTSVAPVIRPKTSRNVLRRKPSTIAQHCSPQQPIVYNNDFESPESWSAPHVDNNPSTQASFTSFQKMDEDLRQPTIPNLETSAPIIPELDRYRFVVQQTSQSTQKPNYDIPPKLATQDLPPPTPVNSGMSGHSRYSRYSGNSGYSGYTGYSASPSTRFSESPGPGTYSRDTTPTSMSSQSPSIATSLRMTPRLHQNSPIVTRPPVSRMRTGSVTNEVGPNGIDVRGLPSLRESLTSSSSNSTVKEREKSAAATKEKKKKKGLSPMPPSPPPRKSSQKFVKSRADDEESPSKSSRTVAQPVVMSSASEQSTSISTQPTVKNTPPARPSRKGTPNLEAQLGESWAVIQSNLTGSQAPADRRQSFLLRAQTTPGQTTASPAPNLTKIPSRDYSPSPVRLVRSESTPAPSGLGIIPDLRPAPQIHQQRQVPASRTPSPSIAAPKHRFGFFTRRNKTETEDGKVVQKETTKRKGPAAGTGHEGYGRYAIRGRSGTKLSSRDRSHSTASSSQESVGSYQTHDPFLLERMSPVVITGGNTSSELSRSESSHSLATTRPSTESRPSFSHPSNHDKEVSRTTLWPSALPRSTANGSSVSLPPKGVYMSENSDNENARQKPSLAVRRSVHPLQLTGQEPLRLPKYTKTSDGGSSPASSSQATSFRSDEVDVKGPKKLSKRPRSPRKWNFFQRSQASASPKPQPNAVAVVVARAPPEKSIPYYAMMDSSEQEDDTVLDMEEILRDAEVFDLAQLKADLPPSNSDHVRADKDGDPRERAGVILPLSFPEASTSQVVTTPEPPVAEFTAPSAVTDSPGGRSPGRPSRLAQVGRIPKVVTARPEQTSPKSFSRPFARVSMIQPLPRLAAVDRLSIAVGPSPERSPSPDPYVEPALKAPADEPMRGESAEVQKAFFIMSSRKDSVATSSSSSGALSFAGTIAIVPEPDAALEEDEVWNEYDDLIGHDDAKIPGSATSSHGMPFQYEKFESRAAREKNGQGKDAILDAVPIVMEKNTSGALHRLELTASSVYSAKSSPNGMPSPGTPISFTDLISGYGDWNNRLVMESGGSKRHSSPHGQTNSRPSSNHSRTASLGDRPRQSTDSRLVTIVEQNAESPLAQVNLRVGSMTISKWLTFGHVLFSPARVEILQPNDPAKHHSILVIDGLGNGQ